MWYHIGISATVLVAVTIYLFVGHSEKMEELVKVHTNFEVFHKENKKSMWRSFWIWVMSVATVTFANLLVIWALRELGKTAVIASACTGAVCIMGMAIAQMVRKSKNE